MTFIKKTILTILCMLMLVSFQETAIAKTKNLKYIGMPVGGIFTGQVYLGGDGQLWNWDIFNIATTDPGGGGDKYYLNPMQQQKKFENGFSIAIKEGKKEYNRTLNVNGFNDITFEGEYPIGKVQYKDENLPVVVNLQAYSPFIPTDVDNSGLPAIIMEYSVSNVSDKEITVALEGWLQNMSCFQSGFGVNGKHVNKVKRNGNYTTVSLSSDGNLSKDHADWGSMNITLVGDNIIASPDCKEDLGTSTYKIENEADEANAPLGSKIVGGLKKSVSLQKGETRNFRFIITWNFPNVNLWNAAHDWLNKDNLRYYYSKRFNNSLQVAEYIIDNSQLIEQTKLWNKTWYDSSLPHDFLTRTFANASTLATTASVRFYDLTDNKYNQGRYYNFEGVYLGEGTCRHVSHYGQVLGRLFPSMARQLREQIDLGLSFSKEGIIKYRGEFSNFGSHDGRGYAADGQAGTILGIYREYLMSPDNTFLNNNWEKIKKAMQYMIKQDAEKDGHADGILEGAQYNTLDRIWYGKIPWISGLYSAALRACAAMAQVVGDKGFAKECKRISELAYSNIPDQLFNGEYFIQQLDDKHLDAPNSNKGCQIDQLLGQYWSSQLGLGYIFPKKQIDSSLRSIMKYNFVNDYDAFLAKSSIPVSRWYADGNEQGLIVCSFPKGGEEKAPGVIRNDWEKLVIGYFSEIWTGQEHAVASTLISEGMIDEAMKVEDAINNRYSPEKRNPYNEIEYGNHYTRAMSGYAPFVSASGFYFNGPEGAIGFSPKMNPSQFKSAFVTSNSWGTYSQSQLDGTENYSLAIKYGSVKLKEFDIVSKLDKIRKATVTCNGKAIKSKVSKKENNKYAITFNVKNFHEGDKIDINVN